MGSAALEGTGSGVDGVGEGAGGMGDGESEEGTPRVEAAERQERVTALVDGVAESVFDLVSSGAGVAGVLTLCDTTYLLIILESQFPHRTVDSIFD